MQKNNFRDAKKNGARISSSTKNFGSNNANRVSKNVPRFGRLNLRAEPIKDTFNLQTSKGKVKDKRIVSGRRGSSSRSWSTYGPNIREARSRNDIKRPFFNLNVPENGYAWWYLDGISNDNTKAISIIAFIGSVFSPWYRWYGRKNPHDHCCINVATYGPKGRWTMTERGEPAVLIKDNKFQVGPSSFNWDRNKLVVDIDELTTPHLSRLKGQVIIEPKYITDIEVLLKDDGSHIWRPFAPISKIQVDLNVPNWQWSGHGYLDGNFGTRALEDDFSYWTWSRLIGKNGAMAFYDAKRREGGDLDLGLEFNNDGNINMLNDIPKTKFSRSLWQVRRETRSDNDFKPKQIQNMLDAPFYSRSKIKTKIKGEEVEGVHEALDLNRFANPLIKPMLALRVPRRRG